jgi:hypothetical protein
MRRSGQSAKAGVLASAAALAAAALAASCSMAPLAQAGTALDWHRPWREPLDPKVAAERSDEYAWALFEALNWPASMTDGAPLPRTPLGADRPGVWETWIDDSSVYREDGHDPGPWQPGHARLRATDRHFEDMSSRDRPNLRRVVAGVMIPVVDPAAGARRLTEARMNRVAFDFVRARQLYNIEGQLRSYDSGRPLRFPLGAREVKAKWRPISEAEKGRYHTLTLRHADGSSTLYGLTALNIASKDLPQWFWATFEHVDNPSLPDNEGWQLPSRDEFACDRDHADCNRAPRGIGLEGSVWQYYRLRGTLTRYTDAQGAPLRLANSELEPRMQSTSSCITCHSRAAVANVDGRAAHLPVFDPASLSPDDPAAHRGYIGEPTWLVAGNVWDGRAYQSLDFVWSLTKAQRFVP